MITVRSGDMTPEEKAFCTNLIRQKDQAIGRSSFIAAIAAQPLYAVGEFFVIPSLQRLALHWVLHVFLVALAVAGLVVGKRRDGAVLMFGIPLAALFPASYVAALYVDVGAQNYAGVVTGLLVAVVTGIFVVLVGAFSRLVVPAGICLYYWASLSFASSGLSIAPRVSFVVGLICLATFALKAQLINGKWLGAQAEYARRKAAEAAEKERQQAELRIASSIQDSCRPTETLELRGMRVSFHMVKHETIGGDWFSAHALAEDTMLALVVDAAGKGIQAALVVHAVQSLWIAAKKDLSFEPRPWIFTLNEALLGMGSGSPHAVALGIIRVDRDQAIYWSAGLGPVYGWHAEAEERKISSHISRGSMLGVSPTDELRISPVIIPLDRTRPEALFFATDGVLSGSRRHDQGTIERLVTELPLLGDRALDAIPIHDDKALIYVTLDALKDAA